MHLTDAGDTTVTVLEGDLDGRVAEGLRAAVAHAGAARRHLVLDLTAVHRIDSRGLGVLVRARQIRAAAGGCLVLAAPSRFVRTVLHTMHLDAAFPVFAHTQDALDWLGRVDSRPPNPR